jgi:6-phosphogluconolactonase (cycloisomerase 2 family)
VNLKPFRFWKGEILSSLMLGVGLVGASPLCAQTAGFAYVVNNSAAGIGSVSAYTINATTGALTPIAGSPFAAGSDPSFVAVSPNGRFAYVAISSDAGIGAVSAYTINATTGALTPVPGSPFAAGLAPTSVAVSPNGRFAYVTNSDFTANDVSAYTINASTGALTPVPGSPFAAGFFPISVTTTAPEKRCKRDDEDRDRDERGHHDEQRDGRGRDDYERHDGHGRDDDEHHRFDRKHDCHHFDEKDFEEHDNDEAHERERDRY